MLPFGHVVRKSRGGDSPSRRASERRSCDRCVGIVDGRTYPVENWSFGGVLLTGDDRVFSAGQALDVTIRFKLREKIFDLTHKASVLRKGKNRIALRLDPLDEATRKGFQAVIDDRAASAFAESQSF